MTAPPPKILEPNDSTEIEEINRFLIPRYDELDTDLYDRISYLDLVSRHREKERLRKLEHLHNIRRLREETMRNNRRKKISFSINVPDEYVCHKKSSSFRERNCPANDFINSSNHQRNLGITNVIHSKFCCKEYDKEIVEDKNLRRFFDDLDFPSTSSFTNAVRPHENVVDRKSCRFDIFGRDDESLSSSTESGADKLSARGSSRNVLNLEKNGHYSPNGSTLKANSVNPVGSSSNNLGEDTSTELKLRSTSPLPQLRDSISNTNQNNAVTVDQSEIGSHSSITIAMDPQIRYIWSEAIDLGEIRNIEDQAEFRSLRVQLGIDRISADTMSRYHVKGHMDGYDQPAICYPRYRGPVSSNRVPSGLKVIRRIGEKLKKENFPYADDGTTKFSGIFGYHMISPSDNRVVLTTNERDSLAVYDSTNGIPALSLPNGERLDQAILPYLEDFELIYLWFPQIHEHHAKDYASYLNASRCYIITKVERPVELIRDNRAKEILHGIQEAVRVRYRGFRSLIDIREEVKNEIVETRSRISGIAQWKRYDVLNHYLKGFRPGELTVLTGGTGYGKTTFLCEYSMDLYSQGIRTLFCSFEMSEDKILKWMIVQFSGPSHVRSLARSRTYHNGLKIPLHRVDHHASVESWLDRFERTHGDLIIMKVDEFRNKSTRDIAEAIKEQVIAGGIQHVVIDNLQFLVGLTTLNNDSISTQEKLNIQDRFVGLLRRIANDYGPHITIVVHPRKNNEFDDLELQNIGGSTRVVQEADNVLVIQRRRDEVDRRRFRKFLYILKNRFGGRRAENDQIEMVFQPSTYTHTLIETIPTK